MIIEMWVKDSYPEFLFKITSVVKEYDSILDPRGIYGRDAVCISEEGDKESKS